MLNAKRNIYFVIIVGFITAALLSSLQTEVGTIIQGMIMLMTFFAVFRLSKIIEGKNTLKKILKFVSIFFIFIAIFMIVSTIITLIF